MCGGGGLRKSEKERSKTETCGGELLKGKFKTKKRRVGRWASGGKKEMKKIIIKKWKR